MSEDKAKTPAEAKAEARRRLRLVYADSIGVSPEELDPASLELSEDFACAFAAACVAEALAAIKTVKLGDLRGIIETINEECTCGGNGPGEGCPACEVYHGIKDMEFKL
jgi:hypothetical protein